MNIKKSYLLVFLLLFATRLSAQIIWSVSEDEKKHNPLELIAQRVLGKNYDQIENGDKEKLLQFLKEINPEIVAVKPDQEAQTFYLDFPEWMKAKYSKITFPPTAAIDYKEEITKARDQMPLWKKFNPQIGLGLNNSYTGEKNSGRKAETIQSDGLQLDLRGYYHLKAPRKFSLYPEIAVTKNASGRTNAFDFDVSGLVSWDLENKIYTSPIAGARFFTTSHVYTNSSLHFAKSADQYLQLMAGGLTQWEFLQRKWATLLLLDYTPYGSLDRSSNTGGNLTGLGYDFSMTTEFFKKFYLTIAFNYMNVSNSQLGIEKYRVNTLVFYPF